MDVSEENVYFSHSTKKTCIPSSVTIVLMVDSRLAHVYTSNLLFSIRAHVCPSFSFNPFCFILSLLSFLSFFELIQLWIYYPPKPIRIWWGLVISSERRQWPQTKWLHIFRFLCRLESIISKVPRRSVFQWFIFQLKKKMMDGWTDGRSFWEKKALDETRTKAKRALDF